MAAEISGTMPRLYGAPAYTRPPRPGEVQRPFDPDDLPLESYRTASAPLSVEDAIGIERDGEVDDWLFMATRTPFGLARR